MARRRNMQAGDATPPPEVSADQPDNPDTSNAAALAELDAAAVADNLDPADDHVAKQAEPTARRMQRAARKAPRTLAPVFNGLIDAGLVDERIARLLTELDPETTRIVLHQLDGMTEEKPITRVLSLANFEPDFLAQIQLHFNIERLKVEVREVDSEPWYFCLILPAREVEKRTAAANAPTPAPAPVLQPATPPPGVDPAMFMMMQMQQQQQATMTQFMQQMRDDAVLRNNENRALLETMMRPRERSLLEQQIEAGAHTLLDHSIKAATMRVTAPPQDPMGVVDQAVEQVAKLGNLSVKMQEATEKFQEVHGAQQAPDFMDKAVGFMESPVGQMFVARILGGKQAAPALPPPTDDAAQERLLAYG